MENNKATLSYSNIASVTHSNNDFIIEFGENVPVMTDWNAGSLKSEINSLIRIATSPKHYKTLLGVMQKELTVFEEKFGKIEIDK